MSKAKNRTIGRSFRINEQLLSILGEEAEKEGISPNALLNRILQDYCSFYRHMKQYPLIILSQKMVSDLISEKTEDEAVILGREAGKRATEDFFRTIQLETHGDNLHYSLEKVLGYYMNWFTYNHYLSKEKQVYHLRHGLGRNWSIFLTEALTPIFKSDPNMKLKTETSEITVTFEIAPPKP